MSPTSSFTRLYNNVFRSRFSVLFSVLVWYMLLSFLLRLSLLIWSVRNVEFDLIYLAKAFLIGFFFDLATGLCFLLLYAVYLLLLPKRWIGLAFDRVATYGYLVIVLFIIYFSLMAELPFWAEFAVRFNFIAVDYLIYTYEVISNINQSYPLPLIISVLVGLVIFTFYLLKKIKAFSHAFSHKQRFKYRLLYCVPLLLVTWLLLSVMQNKQADFGNNLVLNELGKNGTFSFFAAYRSNELDYDIFYPTLAEKEAYSIVKKDLLQQNQQYRSDGWDDIQRTTRGATEGHPNIILITIESFSADFLKEFGNKDTLTPNFENLAGESIFFTNLYATGTRTVRGMEALTLCVPPTPGSSIVRRPHNEKLFSIASILEHKNYRNYFIYGGDGYFDNMNNFFGGQGFDIVDRNRGNALSDNIKTRRYNITNAEVSFENAWGICDEDLYKQSIKYADKSYNASTAFFQFIMTSSNHKPYTFPQGETNLPQGSRRSAVKYTDYALGKFIAAAKTKPWFNNTVFVIVADHCASSAGKWQINIDKHHIPAIIYNLHQPAQKINRLTSQIDLLPTLFGYLGWSYNSSLYGKDINQVKAGEERAFVGNYTTLGLLKQDLFTQIDERKHIKQFKVLEKGRSLSEQKQVDKHLVAETIAYYQTASERFKNGLMKE